MGPLRAVLLLAYFLTLGTLAIYGAHRLYLLCLLYRHRKPGGAAPAAPAELPIVTVQIPIYNELNVAPRLIDAVCLFDYPRESLEIQVLDDSTDETSLAVGEQVARLRALGHDLHHIQRCARVGFKSGALAEGLGKARGEFIAVFDADFVPPPGFLRDTLPSFTDPRVGMVQARWEHLNRSYSALTKVQALLLDGHFLIEHAARNLSGRFFNFNGTAGIWRRACIEDAGGWQHDTLTEDLDLSYRAQLAGWRFVFLPASVAPAELPVDLSAFKTQQRRWAKGSIQTARKILPSLLASPLPFRVRAEAFFHLTSNFAYVLMVLFSVLLVPAMLLRVSMSWKLALAVDVPVLLFSTFSFWFFYVAADAQTEGKGLRGLRTMPVLMSIGIGLAINNARAVVEGLFGKVGDFERTPKHRVEDRSPVPRATRYRAVRPPLPWVEGFFAAYFTVALFIAARPSLWPFYPFLLLFWAGYSYMTVTALAEALRARHDRGLGSDAALAGP